MAPMLLIMVMARYQGSFNWSSADTAWELESKEVMVVDSTGRQESASNTVRLEALTEVVRDPDEVKKPGKAGASILING